jgi:anti-sigma factor RsiW
MECRKFLQDLSVLIDGELEPAAAAALSRHIEECPGCRQAHALMVELNLGLKAASPVPSQVLAARVKQRIAEVQPRTEFTVLDTAFSRLVLMAMIALLALGVGNLAGRSIDTILGSHRSENVIEIVMSDPGSSLADEVMDLGHEENGQ